MERQSKGSRCSEVYCNGGQGPPRAVAPLKKKKGNIPTSVFLQPVNATSMSVRLSRIRNGALQYKISQVLDTVHILNYKCQHRNIQHVKGYHWTVVDSFGSRGNLAASASVLVCKMTAILYISNI